MLIRTFHRFEQGGIVRTFSSQGKSEESISSTGTSMSVCVCMYQCCYYCCYYCCWCLCIDAVVVGFLSHVHTLFVDWNLLWSLGRRFFAKARGVSIVGISRTSWRTFGYKIHVGSSKVDDNMRHRWLWIQGPLLSNTQTIQMSTQCGH